MFKFDFDIEDAEIDSEILDSFANASENEGTAAAEVSSEAIKAEDGHFVELSIEHLLDALPSQISYSPLEIPLSSGDSTYLSRRDLFDARFQLISEGTGAPDEERSEQENPNPANRTTLDALQFLDTPSDLVPGVYEGGLKTWECSLDLVDYLHSLEAQSGKGGLDIRGKSVLELGCGTGVPSLYVLQRIFTLPPPTPDVQTVVHLQDYNASALELVTFPNVFLAWYMSPASTSFLEHYSASLVSSSEPAVSSLRNKNDSADLEFPPPDATKPSDLPITPALTEAFLRSLDQYNVRLKFFAGSWASLTSRMPDIRAPDGYDIVLTSETIYRTDSVPELIDIMWTASHPLASVPASQTGPGKTVDGLTTSTSELSFSTPSERKPLILVAAKVFYFGVGGGVDEFKARVKSAKDAAVDTVWERHVGVGRRIMQISW